MSRYLTAEEKKNIVDSSETEYEEHLRTALLNEIDALRAALVEIAELCEMIMPNSGHGYLSVTNDCHKLARDTLERSTRFNPRIHPSAGRCPPPVKRQKNLVTTNKEK